MKRIERVFVDDYEPGPVKLYLEDLAAIRAAMQGSVEAPPEAVTILVNVDDPDPRGLNITHEVESFEELSEALGEELKRPFIVLANETNTVFSFTPILGIKLRGQGPEAELPFRRIKEHQSAFVRVLVRDGAFPLGRSIPASLEGSTTGADRITGSDQPLCRRIGG